MAEVVSAKWIPYPGIDEAVQNLPGVQASLMAVGRVVVGRMRANVSGARTGPFGRRAFVERDPEDEHTVLAGTKWKLAHLFEFGSANTSVHGWLRSACQGVPNTRYEPSTGP